MFNKSMSEYFFPLYWKVHLEFPYPCRDEGPFAHPWHLEFLPQNCLPPTIVFVVAIFPNAGGVPAQLLGESQKARGQVCSKQIRRSLISFKKRLKILQNKFQASQLRPNCDPRAGEQWFLSDSPKWFPLPRGNSISNLYHEVILFLTSTTR